MSGLVRLRQQRDEARRQAEFYRRELERLIVVAEDGDRDEILFVTAEIRLTLQVAS